MSKVRIPSAEELEILRSCIKYEPSTGKLFWTKTMNSKTPKGKELNYLHNGYFRTAIKGQPYTVHRIVWFLHYNEWPIIDIDHINGIRNDNRITNLRLATMSENCQNRKEHRKGQPIGVGWNKSSNKWQARAPKNYLNRKSDKTKFIGYYDTIDEAEQAVIEFCKRNKI